MPQTVEELKRGPATEVLGEVSGQALALSLDDSGVAAFVRLAGALTPLAEKLRSTDASIADELGKLADVLVTVPELKGDGDAASLEEVIADLETLAAQIHDDETKKRFADLATDLRKEPESSSLVVRCSPTGAEALKGLIEHLKVTGNIGHSFEVVVDPDDGEHRKVFGWDGDGSHRIHDVRLLSKADLSTGDLATGGGLRVAAQVGRFVVRGGETGDWDVVDTETDSVVSTHRSLGAALEDAVSRAASAKVDADYSGVFLRVPAPLADEFPSLGKEDSSPPHSTLLFIGKVSDEEHERVVAAIRTVAERVAPFEVEMTDYGEFTNDAGKTISHMIPRSRGDLSLGDLHRLLRKAVDGTGVESSHRDGPFKAHVTLAYVEPEKAYDGPRPNGTWKVAALEVWRSGSPETVISLREADESTLQAVTGTAMKDSVTITLADDMIDETEKDEVAVPQVHLRILKKEEVEEQRTVLGIVLEPETVDAQGDIYSEEEIEKTAWKFMERYQQFGLQHEELRQDILPLESYLAPCDFELNGQVIKKGTWLLRVRVLDENIWKKVKSGELTGFSIGGSAVRRPERLRRAS